MTQDPLIAVIDDDESVRASVGSLVRSLGYRAALFASVEDFLASSHRQDAAGIVSDVHMPGGLSGLELVERLAGEGSRAPIILMSAFADEGMRDRATRWGVRRVLDKPFEGAALVDCLAEAVPL